MGPLTGITAALALIAGVGFGLGAVDFFFPPQAEVAEPSPIVGEPAAGSLQYVRAHTQLSHPIGYIAVMYDCQPSGRQCGRPQYAFAKERK